MEKERHSGGCGCGSVRYETTNDYAHEKAGHYIVPVFPANLQNQSNLNNPLIIQVYVE